MNDGSSSPLVILAEASNRIGTGHIVEALNLARELMRAGIPIEIIVNRGTPKELLEKSPCTVQIVSEFDRQTLLQLASEFAERGRKGVVTNFRCISNEEVELFNAQGLFVLCIDEWGDRYINCNAVINGSPVVEFHQYQSKCPNFQMYAGLDYMILSRQFQSFHDCDRLHRGSVRSVVISMGGSDRTGATPPLLESILAMRQDLELNVVAGPGFAHGGELQATLSRFRAGQIRLFENLLDLSELFYRSDVGFTAGGDTLAELACVGTPAVVVYEDLHELKQGKVFEEKGFGICLDSGRRCQSEEISKALNAFEDPSVRSQHMKVGKSLVDGKGSARIRDVIIERLRAHSPVASRS